MTVELTATFEQTSGSEISQTSDGVVVYQPEAYERGVRLTRVIPRRDSTKTEMMGDQE